MRNTDWLSMIVVYSLILFFIAGCTSSGETELAKLGLLEPQEVQSYTEKGDEVEIKWGRTSTETITTILPKNIILFKKSANKKTWVSFQFDQQLLRRQFLPAPSDYGNPSLVLVNGAKSGNLVKVTIYRP